MDFDFLKKDAKKMCIQKYEDFLFVLKNQLCGVVQPKFIRNNFNRTSEALSFMVEVGVLNRVHFGGMTVYQLNYSKDLEIFNVRKITKDMVVRSAIRMEHFRSIGLNSFADIRAYASHGNNLSVNNNSDVLRRLDEEFKRREIFMTDFTCDENLKILYRLKANDIYIERIKIKDRTVKPQLVMYNMGISKGAKLASKIIMAYEGITDIFTDYQAGTKVEPTICVRAFGNQEMVNMVACDELLKHPELGFYDMDRLSEKIKFISHELPNVSKYPYSNILN